VDLLGLGEAQRTRRIVPFVDRGGKDSEDLWVCWVSVECKILANHVWRSKHPEIQVDPF
jgi:hypothetical protein